MEITKNDVHEACKGLEIDLNLHDLMAYVLHCEEINKDTDAYEVARDCIDEYIIYYDDAWKIMQAYQTPQEANYNNAMAYFENDVARVVNYLIDNIL